MWAELFNRVLKACEYTERGEKKGVAKISYSITYTAYTLTLPQSLTLLTVQTLLALCQLTRPFPCVVIGKGSGYVRLLSTVESLMVNSLMSESPLIS